jgi:Protein of unknown function (DUF4065)
VNGVAFRPESVIVSSRNGDSIAIDIDRVAAAAHYVIFRTDAGKLGHVKLNRILWYADLEHYRRHGASITGLQHYSRAPQGPLAAEISRAVGLLARTGRVVEQPVAVADYTRREMISLRDPDVLSFRSDEAAILDRMISVVAPLSARQLLQMTSADPLWQEIKPGGAMVIATGSIITRAPSP